ncbi:MAG: mannitol 2-dehydrogenase [Pseudonocardiales bacterium]|nr:mannitol 2-dehydrogenase [Pseudonocardiales bacterium]
MTALSTEALGHLDPRVPIPSYDRSRCSIGIVHFGVGAFHRSHEAMYLDSLMNQGQAHDLGICGVGLLSADAAMRDALAEQDCLYTLVLKHPDGRWEPRVIGSILDYLYAPEDHAKVQERLVNPETKIVSLTITEGGYNLHRVTGDFDANDPAIVADLDRDAIPRTVFGFVVRALAERRRAGIAPFTIMSCDNMPSNGQVGRRAFVAFAELIDSELATWIRDHVDFPNSMVDRITPATTDEDRAALASRFDIDDAWPVLCEPFSQWVLEDHFASGRPRFEDVGVQVVGDVEPYELMKLRLLNASHQALCYAGYLAGHRLVHDVARDPLFAQFLLEYMKLEAIPSLDPVPGIDLQAYADNLIERFSNPEVRDTVARLCANSSDLIPKFILPVLRFQLDCGGSISRCTAVLASWARYAEGTDEQGQPIHIVDPLRDRMTPSALRQRSDSTAFLRNRDVFGDLIDNERFVNAYVAVLTSLHEAGARFTLSHLADLTSATTAHS